MVKERLQGIVVGSLCSFFVCLFVNKITW